MKVSICRKHNTTRKLIHSFILRIVMQITILTGVTYSGNSQVIFENISNERIYQFIDELANQHYISINSAIKPFSRSFIAAKLIEANKSIDNMTKRQKKELLFYIESYKNEINQLPYLKAEKWDVFRKNNNLNTSLNPVGLLYKDTFLTAALNPIWGINYFVNNDGTIFHRWGGLGAEVYLGKNWSFYASLRDNTESELISAPEFINQRDGGGNFKISESGSADYEQMLGGITYSWNWGYIGLVKEDLNWGNNYNGPNIFDDRAPSLTQIKLAVKPAKWLELNYFHGWLVSMVIDSSGYFYNNSRLYYRANYRPKYLAANMFTVTPWKRLNFSFGNSIVYSDMGIHPGYLIPVMFYKAIDHVVNSDIDNQNSQMFFDISTRQIRNLHLYFTLFIDELKTSRLFDKETHNFWSIKLGARESNVLIDNLSATIEYTKTRPITFNHRVPTLTFESNYYNLGHYLIDNSHEIYFGLDYKPISKLLLSVDYLLAQNGPDYDYVVDENLDRRPFLEKIVWENESISFKVAYEFTYNSFLFVELLNSHISGEEEYLSRYTPKMFRGDQNTISFGFNIGY